MKSQFYIVIACITMIISLFCLFVGKMDMAIYAALMTIINQNTANSLRE